MLPECALDVILLNAIHEPQRVKLLDSLQLRHKRYLGTI